MLNPYHTSSILWSKGMINLPAKAHLLSFTKTVYFLLLLQPTVYFKPYSEKTNPSPKLPSDFSLQGNCSAQSLTALASVLFIYSIYSCSCKKNSLSSEESWLFKRAGIGKCWERLSCLVLQLCSHAPQCGCGVKTSPVNDCSWREGRDGLGLSATSHCAFYSAD